MAGTEVPVSTQMNGLGEVGSWWTKNREKILGFGAGAASAALVASGATKGTGLNTLVTKGKERRDRLTQERDGLQQWLDRLLDLVAGGEAPAKSVAPKIAEQQLAIDGLDRQIAGCDAEIAASAMSQANADHLLAHWRTCVQGLADEPPAVQRQTLQAVVKEVHLGSGEDLRLVCWPLRPDGDGGGKLAPPPSQPTHDGPNTANPGNKTTTVGSDGSRVWRRGRDSDKAFLDAVIISGFTVRHAKVAANRVLMRGFCADAKRTLVGKDITSAIPLKKMYLINMWESPEVFRNHRG